jgi:hypothetical protein
MTEEVRELKRSELYALVWEKAVQRVAADIGISNVALAKTCKKHRIPVPERGYWRRKEWGYKVRQEPLPPLPDGSDPILYFYATPRPEEAPATLTPEGEFERRPENAVVVPETLDKLSRPVRHTLAGLRKRKADDNGLVGTWAKDCFRIQVAPASLDRVTRLLQALVDAFAARGYELLEGDEGGGGIRVKVKGEALSFSLVERLKQVPHVVTEREEIRQELNPGWSPVALDTVPTGTLVLRIKDAPGPLQHGVFRDRVTLKLEQRLNGFLARMAESARLLKEQREAREEEQRKWEAEARAREETRQIAEVEGARFRRIERLARLWQRREAVRGFVEAVKERMKVARRELVPAAQAWVEWAEKYLDEHHPEDPLFFEPLLDRKSNGYYHWTGHFGDGNEWFEQWGG